MFDLRCALRARLLAPVALAGAAAASPGVVAAQTPVELDGIVVTATPTPTELSRLGNHVTLIDAEDLSTRGITRVADVLREVPGVSVARSGSFGGVTSVFFRGGESDYVQVMIDGVPVNQPGGAFDFSGLTTENVERIEIVRGPSSALHGSDAVAGVIHIVTRSGSGLDGLRTSAELRAGSFGRFDTSIRAAGGSGRASYSVGLARYRTDGILDFNNAAENTVLSGKAAIELDDATRATISARIGDRTFGFPTDFTGAVVDVNQFTFADESSLSFELDREFSDRLSLRVLLATYSIESGIDDRVDSPADTLGSFGAQSLDDFDRRSFDLRASFVPAEGWVATAGAEVETQDVRSFGAYESSFGTTNVRSSNSRDNRAVYAHLSTALGGVDLNGGIRLEDNERYGDFTTWQLGASFTIDEATRVRAVAGRAIKEPTFVETFSQGFALGNPDLDPEQSTSWEIGAERTFLDGALRLQATWFDQSFTDLIQYTFAPPSPGDPNYFNVAEAASRGLEFGAEATLFGVHLYGDWTRLDTEVVDSGFDSGEGATFVNGAALLRRPEGSGRLGVGVTVTDRIRFDGVARYVGERADRDFTAFPSAPVTLDAYMLFDLGITTTISRVEESGVGFDLGLRVENATDESYTEIFGFRTPGRGVYLTGTLAWGPR